MVAYEEEDYEDGLEVVKEITAEMKGTVYDQHVADHEWEDRFYPMKIKKLGPTLVVGQAFAPLESLEALLDDFHWEQASAKAGMDGIPRQAMVVLLTQLALSQPRTLKPPQWRYTFSDFSAWGDIHT